MTNEQFELWIQDNVEKLKAAQTENVVTLCECGGDAVKAVHHAQYCPKYENT